MGIFIFSSSSVGFSEDFDLVGEKVLVERSVKGPAEKLSLVGDILCCTGKIVEG